MKSILVFCGANTGTNPIYTQTARNLGQYFVKNKIKLIYGGGGIGLMGEISNEIMHNGGEVIGVIPHFLDILEVGNPYLTETIKVNSMHERKATMANLCEGIITLPGGFGSMDELFEILTWAQLNLHQKPIGILNINGFYDLLLQQIEFMVQEGFIKPQNQKLLIVENSIEKLFESMHNYLPEKSSKWIDKKFADKI